MISMTVITTVIQSMVLKILVERGRIISLENFQEFGDGGIALDSSAFRGTLDLFFGVSINFGSF